TNTSFKVEDKILIVKTKVTTRSKEEKLNLWKTSNFTANSVNTVNNCLDLYASNYNQTPKSLGMRMQYDTDGKTRVYVYNVGDTIIHPNSGGENQMGYGVFWYRDGVMKDCSYKLCGDKSQTYKLDKEWSLKNGDTVNVWSRFTNNCVQFGSYFHMSKSDFKWSSYDSHQGFMQTLVFKDGQFYTKNVIQTMIFGGEAIEENYDFLKMTLINNFILQFDELRNTMVHSGYSG
ncbi:hypothetical protein LWX64_002682, partial [Enterococcus faecalis]|nr:hypothetical protein [Enterococcus faecalis]